MFSTDDLEHTYNIGDYTVKLYYLPQCMSERMHIGYEMFHHDKLIFSGQDYSPSPCLNAFSDDSAIELLGFLSLKIGDVDLDYFDNYTPDQIAWRDEFAEALQYALYSAEEAMTSISK